MADIKDLTDWLNEQLEIANWPDYDGAANGLQVARQKTKVQSIGYAVDASLHSVREAVEKNVDLLLVHHGILWGKPRSLTGPWGEMIRLMFSHDMALYSAHLPLDGHPELGNNILLAGELGLSDMQPFGLYEDRCIGYGGATEMNLGEIGEKLAAISGRKVWQGNVERGYRPRRLAVVSGSGGAFWSEARIQGYGALVTGECDHHVSVEADNHGFPLFFAGHYHTEIFGVRETAKRLSREFDLAFQACGRSPIQ